MVGAQPSPGVVRHRLCRRCGSLCPPASAAGRHSRSLRHPGHRLHRISGTGAAGDRGPDHLSPDDRHADGVQVEAGARGFSVYALSFVYVMFEGATDIYWARSRVLEFLNGAASRLPAGVTPTIGPDATGVGWVYQYPVMSKQLNLSDTRLIQDWNLKFALAKAEGVAEVASVGGFVRQYNVILDSQRMRDLGITMPKMRDAIRASNADVGGRTVELSEFEYVIRGKGYLRSINDLGNIVLKNDGGTPVLLRDIARVELGPDESGGITKLNGAGDIAS